MAIKTLLVVSVVAFVGAVSPAIAQTFPTRTIRIVVPYPPGGGTDLAARLIAQKLTESLGRSVIVENRAGANGNIGTDAMAKAAPDGYTIGMATPGPVTAGKSLYPNLPYDPERDLAPVILVNASPNATRGSSIGARALGKGADRSRKKREAAYRSEHHCICSTLARGDAQSCGWCAHASHHL